MVRSNPRLADPPDPVYLDEVQRYWERHFGRRVDPRWHIACANMTGVEDAAYVPHDVWWDSVVPFFNDLRVFPAYSDKNLYDTLLRGYEAPTTVLKRMRGRYYDASNRPLAREAAVDAICAEGDAKVVKPSRRDNGEGVRRLTIADGKPWLGPVEATLEELERQYGADFLVQAMIIQHPAMAEVHPDSVNTLRLLTFRWQDTIRPLMSFARFGTNGAVNDNAGTGGICCGIDEDGRLHEAAVDELGRHYAVHPSTGYDFGRHTRVPGFEGIRDQVLRLHEQLPHFDLVSWDMAVGPREEPIFVEVNFRGASYVYQYACRRSVFGELTPEVLRAIRKQRESWAAAGRPARARPAGGP